MTLTLTVAGTPLPLPRAENPLDVEYAPFGITQRTANATLRTQYITHKWKVRVYWIGLTQAEKNSLLSVYTTYTMASAAWVFPTGLTFTGRIPMSTWAESMWFQPGTDTPYYDVNFSIEEV